MRISDRLLKQYLQHVYWICGGPCGGKSTMAELVSAKWGMSVYSSDDHTFEYKQLANPQDHPAILRYFVDWEWYFLGQGNDRNQWLVSAAEESVEFTLLALLQMGKGKPIVVDTDIAPEFLRAIAGDERMVYVYAEDELIRRDYFNRDHLRGMLDLFPTLSDPERAKRETLEGIIENTRRSLQRARQHHVQHYIRNAQTTKEEMLAKIETHFGLN
ncbi:MULTISPECIES: hypothetical protein [unclassified Paenibacillus]|uniref:hypothetical protein n=1 Tax=unclassified Paenibacillus TaxID=185978 RepID=UPI0030F80B8D